MPRTGSVQRKTKETDLRVTVDLDGNGDAKVDTGIPFFDHMLETVAKHGALTLEVSCKGDLHIDQHHTVEDTGIALGKALDQALGDRKGIARAGCFYFPLDEALARSVVDLSGRAFLHWNVQLDQGPRSAMDLSVLEGFFKAVADGVRANVHVDLGLGNLGSVLQALARAGGEPRLSADPAEIGRGARVVLPGVAAFGLGMDRARRLGLRGALDEALRRGAPVLGICLGMQILFDEGEEDGLRKGLGLLPGRVTRLPPGVQVPHIGWQRLQTTAASPLLADAVAPWAYFANSYRCEAAEEVTQAVADHSGVHIAAVVGRANVHGVQFHPEKSARDGEAMLARFLRLPEAAP